MTENNLLSMTCDKCGGQLELDLDNLQKYCTHCGGKILVDPAVFGGVLLERECTKQAEISAAENMKAMEQVRREWESNERRHTNRNRLAIILGAIGLVLFAIGGILGELDNPDSVWYLVAFVGMVAAAVAGVLALITTVSEARRNKTR